MMIVLKRLVGAVALGLLSSCASMRDGPEITRGCSPGNCNVSVTVVNCAVTVSPDPITLPTSKNIKWTIDSSGFKFPPSGGPPSDGILITGYGFTLNPGVNGNRTQFKVHDDRTDKRPNIKYVVQVIREADGQACPPHDPFINNQ